MLPALNLSTIHTVPEGLKETDELEEVDASLTQLTQLTRWLMRPPQQAVTPGRRPVHDAQDRVFLLQVLEKGAVGHAGILVSGRVYQLVVDIAGVPAVASVGVLKGLVTNSWIVSSNIIATAAGKVEIETAIVRGLIMLLVKRALRIKQMGPVADVLTMLSFVKLAAQAMTTANYRPELASTLSEVSAIPVMIYTALASLVVDGTNQLLSYLEKVGWRELLREAAETLKPAVSLRHRLGKKGEKFMIDWKQTMESNKQLREYVQQHAVRDLAQSKTILSDFNNFISY